jgi:hypothetical protein
MPSVTAAHSKSRLATRLSFAAAGFGVACWAPLVPFAKALTPLHSGGQPSQFLVGQAEKLIQIFPWW